ncbi:hypothetical protein [Arthrobacter sp. LFS091]|uniref:hypothetical protein n=1 Tax=Arthrobacter sp. LFS091 TaxID=3229892 RepID=UPI003A8013AD
MSNLAVNIEWLVATVAPWTISPHPNFGVKTITPAAKLALITEYRDLRELDRYTVELIGESSAWQEALLVAARDSLFSDGLQDAVDRLWVTSEDQNVPVGARAAAALYASVGLADLERPDRAAERLLAICKSLGVEGDPREHSPEYRLCIALLLQQRVVRLEEASEYRAAREEVDKVILWMPAPSAIYGAKFPVSQGISWGPARIQKDIAESVKVHALASKSTFEQFSGSTWMKVVKGRASWIDERMSRTAADRDRLVVRDAFEKTYESTSGTRYLMREDPSDRGYAALLVAELSGHSGRMKECRESLAKALILEGSNDVDDVAEVIRLLRQGRARKSLQSVLKWVRDQGPTRALKRDAEKVLQRSLATGKITETDLSVLDSAADFLSHEDLQRAIKVTFMYPDTEQVSIRAEWAVFDKMWKTLSRFIIDSGQDDQFAAAIFECIQQAQVLNEPLVGTLMRAMELIQWQNVSVEATAAWAEWINSNPIELAHPAVQDDSHLIRRKAQQLLMEAKEEVGHLSGLERAAFLADHGGTVDAELLATVRSELITMLEVEGASARNGAISLGGYSTSNVAVAFAFRFGDDSLWAAICKFLQDPDIDGVLKDAALDRIANRPQTVPDGVRKSLRDGWGSLFASRREDLHFDAAPLPVFASAIRMAGALGIISQTEALENVLFLASSTDTSRVQAARSIPYVLSLGDPTWGHALLLQLAKDSNPEVRAEAGHALVLALSHISGLAETARKAIVELMSKDGIRAPLRVLHAFQRLQSDQPEIVRSFMVEIQSLTSEASPRVVRRAAELLTRAANGGSDLQAGKPG